MIWLTYLERAVHRSRRTGRAETVQVDSIRSALHQLSADGYTVRVLTDGDAGVAVQVSTEGTEEFAQILLQR